MTSTSLTTALKSLARIDRSAPVLIGDHVNVSFLLDSSSSMNYLMDATIQAFNTYLGELRSNPHIRCSLYEFPGDSYSRSTHLKTIYTDLPAASAFELSHENWHPGGGTPLYLSITDLLTRLYNTKQNERHVVVILTDGEDTGGQAEIARSLITSRRLDGWQILFLGAGIDIDRMAKKLGIDKNQSLSYDAHNHSTEMFKALAGSINEYASQEAHEEIDISSVPQLGRK